MSMHPQYTTSHSAQDRDDRPRGTAERSSMLGGGLMRNIFKSIIASLIATLIAAVGVGANTGVSNGGDPEVPDPVAPRPPVRQLPPNDPQVVGYLQYRDVIRQTAGMVGDSDAQRMAAAHGMKVLNVTWEDTGRFKNLAVGPNISDMTIQVQQMDPRTEQFELSCMPVIRFPNFEDKTGDVPTDRFQLLVGNEKPGGALRKITLKELLQNPTKYMTNADSWKSPGGWFGKKPRTLWAERDTHVLVSAQACFLPIPRSGEATFNPVLFNYQSGKENPAVLAILVTPQGTSMTVIDNTRDAFAAGQTWGQRLFFNKAGERAPLTGKRLSDVARPVPTPLPGDRPGVVTSAVHDGANMVMLIQVPLKHKDLMRSGGLGLSFGAEEDTAAATSVDDFAARKSDVEAAVIGHGRVEGPFTEVDNLPVERDPRFPVRVTVQFYKATSNGVVDDRDVAQIARQIQRVYDDADYVGSLVVEGETGRPTEHDGPKAEPADWWQRFWEKHERETLITQEQTMVLLRQIHGEDYRPTTEAQLRRDIEALRAEK